MIEWDSQISLRIVQLWYGNPRWFLVILEWMVHGLIWLPASFLAFVFSVRWKYPKRTQYKLGVLLFDLILVGIMKLSVRRSRPPYNDDDQVFEAPVADKFSFPSGHTSRATMLTIFLVELQDIQSIPLLILIHGFPVLLGLSRVALGRHYLTDVIGGLLLGSMEAIISLQVPPGFFKQVVKYTPVLFT